MNEVRYAFAYIRVSTLVYMCDVAQKMSIKITPVQVPRKCDTILLSRGIVRALALYSIH